MGHREDLLEGAKRCLLEKGYARTTARDIVTTSGTNLASIGYHYGSKDALLQQAVLAVTEEWGDMVDLEAAGGPPRPDSGPERFEDSWERVLATFDAHRSLWKLQLEVVARLDGDEELREAIKAAQVEARSELAQLFGGADYPAGEEDRRAVGRFHQALTMGVMIQWLTDPDTAPSAQDLVRALRAVQESWAGAAVRGGSCDTASGRSQGTALGGSRDAVADGPRDAVADGSDMGGSDTGGSAGG
ncbi:TetR/AcrR family transcriptional regulator [Streptomyces sp. NPDC055078]